MLWDNKTMEMCHKQPDMVDMIPKASELDIEKTITIETYDNVHNVFYQLPSKRLH